MQQWIVRAVLVGIALAGLASVASLERIEVEESVKVLYSQARQSGQETIEQHELLLNKTRQLANQALQELSSDDSRGNAPKRCNAPAKFRSAKNRGPGILLTSAPGSGNTMLRSLIRTGTRFFTGSVYTDQKLYARGFKGEVLAPAARKSYIVKSHYPFFTYGSKHSSSWINGVLHLVRAPFDAGLSECKRRYTGLHTADMRTQRIINKCPGFMRKYGPKWAEMMRFWETPITKPPPTSPNHQFFALHTCRRETPFQGLPVVTMWYEDFRRAKDKREWLAYLFAFIKALNPDDDQLPSVADAVRCALSSSSTERVRRKHVHGDPNIFQNRSGTASVLGRQLCEKEWGTLWNTQKWGDCLRGDLQAGFLEHE